LLPRCRSRSRISNVDVCGSAARFSPVRRSRAHLPQTAPARQRLGYSTRPLERLALRMQRNPNTTRGAKSRTAKTGVTGRGYTPSLVAPMPQEPHDGGVKGNRRLPSVGATALFQNRSMHERGSVSGSVLNDARLAISQAATRPRRESASIVTAASRTSAVTMYFDAAVKPKRPMPLSMPAITIPPSTP
jgi:hypothetical protein